MLVYEKKVENERHLFGTMGNIPSADDVQLTYQDDKGATVEPSLDYTYLDDGHGGIMMVADGTKTPLNVFIGEVNIIPGDFAAPEYSITVTAGENGTAVADKETAKEGEEVTLTITPAQGYEVDEITVNEGGVVVDNNKFTMGDEDVEISVTFKAEEIEYTITLSYDDTKGVVTSDPASKAKSGDEVTISVSGGEVDTVVVKDADNQDVAFANDKFTMPASNVTVTVTFK